ncbi:MAG: ATPase, T2SS/T4P/T4SS family [Candidatus Micrarchaeota archaeon]
MNCQQCAPETAPCKLVCPQNAIKVEKGILVIDAEECDGCKKCVSACPAGAILIQNKKAIKCDLCMGEPKCIKHCPEDALFMLEEKLESLGWEIKKESADYTVALPELTNEEESVVLAVAREFTELSKMHPVEKDRDGVKKQLAQLAKNYCLENSLLVEKKQFDYLVEIALMHTFGYGVLDPLLANPNFEEIAVVGANKFIYVYERKKGWLKTNCRFTNSNTAIDAINKMARPLGRRVTLGNPRINAVLPDGSRLHASVPPLSELELTIRKFRQNPFSAPELAASRTFSFESLALLWLLMQADLSIVIAGNTASGKTTTMNALFSFVPADERILILEETPEINIPHEHQVKLVSNHELGIDMCELVRDSLRMRPDRVIVGEVRTPDEVSALFETILSGQARGSYATFHAQSAREALTRMQRLGIATIDLCSLDLILVQRRMLCYNPKLAKKEEIRRVVEIAELEKEPNENEPPKLTPLFRYSHSSDSLEKIEKAFSSSLLLERLKNSFNISQKELEDELALRKNFLESLAKKDVNFLESVSQIQKLSFDKEFRKRFAP